MAIHFSHGDHGCFRVEHRQCASGPRDVTVQNRVLHLPRRTQEAGKEMCRPSKQQLVESLRRWEADSAE
jgi:hypothetical protein